MVKFIETDGFAPCARFFSSSCRCPITRQMEDGTLLDWAGKPLPRVGGGHQVPPHPTNSGGDWNTRGYYRGGSTTPQRQPSATDPEPSSTSPPPPSPSGEDTRGSLASARSRPRSSRAAAAAATTDPWGWRDGDDGDLLEVQASVMPLSPRPGPFRIDFGRSMSAGRPRRRRGAAVVVNDAAAGPPSEDAVAGRSNEAAAAASGAL